jgi:hypothetical protein
MKQEREKKLTYGPRDVNDVPWALLCGGDRGRRLRRDEELWEEGERETSRMVEPWRSVGKIHCLFASIDWECIASYGNVSVGGELGQLESDQWKWPEWVPRERFQ